MNEIRALLEKSQQGGLDNCLRLEEVRQWLVSYLELHDEETQRFPLELGRPHWDLLLADRNHDVDGMYILAFFCGEDVTFLAGRGSISDIREFAESEFPRRSRRSRRGSHVPIPRDRFGGYSVH